LPVSGIAFVACLAGAQAPGPLAWTSGPDLPSPRAACVALLAPDGAVILLGGTSPSGDTVVPKLADGASAWATAWNSDTRRHSPGAVRYASTGILLFGGNNGAEPTDEVLLYDYVGGDSQDAEKASVGRHQFAFAADGSGRCYAVGGLGNAESGDIFSSAERYTPSMDAWEDIADFPDARYGATGTGAGNTHVYVFGGATAGGIQSSGFRYVLSTGTWEPVASMPVPVRNAAAALSEGRIYVSGGIAETGPTAVVQVYDLAAGTWSLDEPLPAPRYGHGAAVGASGRLVVAGGYDASDIASASVWQSQQLNVPEVEPSFSTSPVTSGSLDRLYRYEAGALGNPPPSFSLIASPSGMTIDAASGRIEWQPVAGQSGIQSVTIRATNRVGFADQTFDIAVVNDTIPPTAPTDVRVTGVTADSVDLAWTGATDENGVSSYGVYRKYRCGFRGIKRCYAPVQDGIPGESTTVSGLPSLTTFTYVIRAFDADGNESGNSAPATFTTLSPPVNLRYTGATTLPANFPLQLQFFAGANPPATFTVVSGPAALAVDAATGVVTWTPTPADVGTHEVEVMAHNEGGSTRLTVTVTVSPDAPQLSVQHIPGAGGHRDAVAGSPWSAQVLDGSHTPSTFEILSGPAGMTIDPFTGLLSWVPAVDDAGLSTVTVRATNAASTADIVIEFYVHFTGPVSDIQVMGLTDLEPVVSWSGPTGTGADRTAGYAVVARSRYRYGRFWRTHQVSHESEGTNTWVVLSGLMSGKTYDLYINALDEDGHRGLTHPQPVSFASVPGLPLVGWSVRNAGGGTHVIAGQEAVVQLTSNTTNFGPVVYALLSGPAGFTLDPVTGEGRWTPSAAHVGTVEVTIRAANDIGPRDLTIGIRVHFSGPVRNAFCTRSDDSAFANWQPPGDNVFPVVSYRVTMHWQWSSRRRSRTMDSTATSLSFGLIPTGAVWHKGITIVPVDASGNSGVSTPLIPYNGALPADLPASDPVWIERIVPDSNGGPVLEILGDAGATADIEVTDDLVEWGILDTITVGEDGVLLYPDPQGKEAQRGSYRLLIH
jgi:hypothetical protein